MIVFDFIYFCIYSFVPDKAIFGKRDVACTFFATFSSFVVFGICLMTRLIEKNTEKEIFLIDYLIVWIILFILIRNFFLKPEKFRKMHRKFRKIPKWVLRTSGILYLLLCLIIFFVMLTIVKNYY